VLRGENTRKVYRLGDRLRVQVLRVDTERRLIDLGVVSVLEAMRGGRVAPDARRSRTRPKSERRQHTARQPRKGKQGRKPSRRR